jgi:hypothetical protein
MSYTLPNIAIPDSEKDEDYHKRWVQAICSSSFTGNWALKHNKLRMLYHFYAEGTGSDLTGYLQTTPDGSAMPGIWSSANSVKTRVRALLGEFEQRSYMIKCRPLNSEAIDRQREEQERLRVARVLQDLRQYVEDETGVSLASPEYVPQSDDELREYMDLTWKDKHALIIEGALKWTSHRGEDDENRKSLILDQFIAGISPAKTELISDVPLTRRIDPLKFGFDQYTTDDRLSDATYFWEVEYLPLADIAQRYNLSEKELQEAAELYGDGAQFIGNSDNSHGWDCMPGQILRWFRVINGTPRGLVVKAVWRDYKTMIHKYEVNDQGVEFYQEMPDEKSIRRRDKEKIKRKRLISWHGATLIAGKFLKEWGECANQPRNLSQLEIARPPYEVWINEYKDGSWVSLVEQTVGLQTLKDIAEYQLQVQMARAVGKVLVFDEAFLADGMTYDMWVSRLKADGIAWINSKEYQQTTGNMNMIHEYDLGLSQAIAQGIGLIDHYDRQIDAITGISPERTGAIQGASVSTGTTNASLIQSGMVTASYFKGFERFWSRILQYRAGLVKIAWANKKIFAPIIGDVGVDFLRDNIDISLDEFDVVVQSMEPTIFDKQTLMQWLGFAVQSDPGFLPDAMEIMMEPDITVATRKYQRKSKLRARILAQQAQQQQEAEAQAADAQRQFEATQQQQGQQGLLELQQLKDKGGLSKTLATGRTKLHTEKIKALTK